MDRVKKIIMTSVLGIVVNAILVAVKVVIGLLSGSIAIMLDAVNNLSDALSSIITIIGTKLAGKKADKKHPFGYGRIEYMTGVIIAAIVLFAGISSIRESIDTIIHPEAATYSNVTLAIIVIAIVVKIVFGQYVKRTGVKYNSDALVASGSEAIFDAVLSAGTLVAALISIFFKISLEGYFGAIISIIIIKAGIEMLLDTLNSIIGERSDPELTNKIKERIKSFEGVRGAYDLTLHNYGPTQIIGSVHIEVADDMIAKEFHQLSRRIVADIYNTFGIVLTVGLYATNNSDTEIIEIRDKVDEILKSHPEVMQIHGFYVDKENKNAMFDMVIKFGVDEISLRDSIQNEIGKAVPGYHFDIVLDPDMSE